MFITAVCVIFLIKLRWPKSKSLYDTALIVLHGYCIFISLRCSGYNKPKNVILRVPKAFFLFTSVQILL